MPLTRHLYELDEVVSALQICLCKGWTRGLFWLWELIASQEEDLASDTLTDGWLQWGGGQDPHLLSLPTDLWIERFLRIQEAIKAAGSLHATRLLTLTSDLPVRPSVTPRPKSERVAARRRQRSATFVATLESAETIDATEATHFWISFDSACRQGGYLDAVWLLQAAQDLISADAIWSALTIAARGSAVTKDAIALLKKQAGPQQLLYQTSATLFLCTPTAQRERPVDPVPTGYHGRLWAEWTANIGRRHARIHAIPVDALHAKSTRGRIPSKYTNIEDVRDPIPLLSEGCKFWKEALRSYNIVTNEETGETEMPDDAVLETFYDRYFPDDVPDEWSKADQEKSHGRGCQEKATPEPLVVHVREEPVARRAWNCAIHVRA